MTAEEHATGHPASTAGPSSHPGAEYPTPKPLPHPSLRRLVGCDYGTGVGLPDDRGLSCQMMAVQRVVVRRPKTGERFLVQLCERHLEVIMRETTPSDV